MIKKPQYSVKQVAVISGISIRTLHYYDEIGLLPSQRTLSNNYRYYTDDDLLVLQQILLLKEMDFSLKQIVQLIQSGDLYNPDILSTQRQILRSKINRMNHMIDLIDQTIDQQGDAPNMGQVRSNFKAFDHEEILTLQRRYEKEVREKYDARLIQESQERAQSYTKDDWKNVSDMQRHIYRRIVDAMRSKKAVDDPDVLDAVALYQQSITDAFYTCTDEILAGLGQMYVEDERFMQYYESIHPGLALYFSMAIAAYVNK